MDIFYWKGPYLSIYQRVLLAKRTAKIYYFDQPSSTMEIVNLLKDQTKIFGTFDQFLDDCKSGNLPDYSFVEPNYSDHDGPGGGELLASDQHPDHNVQQGEIFISAAYNAIFDNPDLWKSTALLIVYDEHGGTYDHVPPPQCLADGFVASAQDTGTAADFKFDRLGVRVPAILVSPWVPKGTVVPGSAAPGGRVFRHCVDSRDSDEVSSQGSRARRVAAWSGGRRHTIISCDPYPAGEERRYVPQSAYRTRCSRMTTVPISIFIRGVQKCPEQRRSSASPLQRPVPSIGIGLPESFCKPRHFTSAKHSSGTLRN